MGGRRLLNWRIYTALALLCLLFFLGSRTGWWTNNPSHVRTIGNWIVWLALPMAVLAFLSYRQKDGDQEGKSDSIRRK
jgi:Ni/Fe-hydrogenase subunit HybB-like protein